MFMVKKLADYFNIMALVIRELESMDELKEKDFFSVFGDRNNEYHLNLRTQVPELIQDNREPGDIRITDLNEGFLYRLRLIIQHSDKFQLLLLLFYMDKAVVKCYDGLINYEEDWEEVNSLNTNAKETGIIILKKVKCNWDGKQADFRLRDFLDYFFYIKNSNLHNAVVKNYVLDQRSVLGYGTDCLRVAISPVTKNKTLSVSKFYDRLNKTTKEHQRYFRVESLLNEQDIRASVEDNIIYAGEAGVDILVFPEMLGSRDMLEAIKASIAKVNTRKPPLVVFPSIWEKSQGDTDNTNISCVLLQGEEVLFEQPKRYNFRMIQGISRIYEDINCEKHDLINLLHIEGLGRICIVICYDFLVEDNRYMIFDNLKPSLICTPSFSTGSFNFLLLSETGFPKFCNWVWCNTCSAACEGGKDDNYQTIGVITKLSKNCDLSSPESLKEWFRGKASCEKPDCRHCIYYSDIPLKISHMDS